MRLISSFLLALLLVTPAAMRAQDSSQQLLQQFQHLEDSWSIALVNKDQFALDNLLATNFIDISADAKVRTRNQRIADALAGIPEQLLSMEQRVVDVRVVGDVAVVEGTYMTRWKTSGSHTRDERGMFTHVYQRSHNVWASINAQQTAVVEEVDEGRKKKAPAQPKTPSNAQLPFHLPLLGHDSDSGYTPQQPSSNPQ